MSEQDGTAATKQSRSRRTRKQNGSQLLMGQRPADDNKEGWKAFWEKQGQAWRTEPEIEEERKRELAQRRDTIIPNIQKGVYPFKDMERRLTRADIEWLLATHENGRGPVNWSDKNQRGRIGLDLRGADLRGINLENLPLARTCAGPIWATTTKDWLNAPLEVREKARIHLEKANLSQAHLEGSNLVRAYMERAYLVQAHLEGSDLSGVVFVKVNLTEAHLDGATLTRAHLEGANLLDANLEGANLSGAFFDSATYLVNVSLGKEKSDCASLADVHWGGVDLSAIQWIAIKMLGDERETRQTKKSDGTVKDRVTRISDFRAAVRANRQLAVVLRDQGISEVADRFAYRAQLLKRGIWIQQRRYVRLVGSWLLAFLAGYGYRPLRSVSVYLLLILGFAIAFYSFGHLKWYEALVVSLTAFHGRGFFSQDYQPGDPQSIIAAIEAVVGLLIEISFIATFTKRFFGS